MVWGKGATDCYEMLDSWAEKLFLWHNDDLISDWDLIQAISYVKGFPVSQPDKSNSVSGTPEFPPPKEGTIDEYFDKIILRGKIVTMNSEDDWFEGYLLIQNEKIQKIWEGIPSEINLSDYNLIETDGIIFPGLINIHNHMYYSTLPLWNVEDPYKNRYQWNHGKFYQTEVSWPKNILTNSSNDDLRVEVVKYAEVKALIGGTTSIVGAKADKKYGEILVRNIEYENFGKKKIATSVTKISSVDGNNIKSRFNAGTLDTWLVHLAEGIDDSSKKEFERLDSKGLLREETVIVHGTALESNHFDKMNEKGLDLVWSPLSNLLLYGKTTDVVTASENGVQISLSTDWGPSGTKNLAVELKVADQINKNRYKSHFSDYELVKMVTVNPAHTLKWENYVGTISTGLYADLLIINDSQEDPYRTLINSIDSDVLLVFVDGDPLYGKKEWMEKLKPSDYEEVECDNMVRAIDVTKDGVTMGDQKWLDIEQSLSDAMSSFSDYEKNYPGIHDMTISPIFTSCDREFFTSIQNSVNANLEFDLWNIYYN